MEWVDHRECLARAESYRLGGVLWVLVLVPGRFVPGLAIMLVRYYDHP